MYYKAFAEKVLSRLDRLDPAQIEAFFAHLRRDFRLFETVFNEQRDGLVLTHYPAGTLALINRKARRLLDVEDERRGLGESWQRVLRGKPFEELRARLESFYESGQKVEDERIVIAGRRRTVCEVTLRLLDAETRGGAPRSPRGNATHALWILHDADKKNRRHDEQERERYVEFMATLTAGLAHEIRNPLNSLTIHATLLDQGLREILAEVETHAANGTHCAPTEPETPSVGLEADLHRLGQSARILTEEIGRLSRIVDQFLNAARPVRLDRKPTRVEWLFEQVLDLLGPECRAHGIEIVSEPDTELPTLPLDPSQMHQVLLNLAKNAIEAIGPEGGRIVLRSRMENDYAILEVADTGEGIRDSHRTKIFEPYYSTKKTGSGLGLMVVWRIVKAHGGAIAVDSRKGDGTTFSIALPLDSRPVRMLTDRTVKSARNASEDEDAREWNPKNHNE